MAKVVVFLACACLVKGNFVEQLHELLPNHVRYLSNANPGIEIFPRENETIDALEQIGQILLIQGWMLNPFLETIPDGLCKRDFKAYFDGLKNLDFSSIASESYRHHYIHNKFLFLWPGSCKIIK